MEFRGPRVYFFTRREGDFHSMKEEDRGDPKSGRKIAVGRDEWVGNGNNSAERKPGVFCLSYLLSLGGQQGVIRSTNLCSPLKCSDI